MCFWITRRFVSVKYLLSLMFELQHVVCQVCLLWGCFWVVRPDAKQGCRDCEQFVLGAGAGALGKRHGVLLKDKTVCLYV